MFALTLKSVDFLEHTRKFDVYTPAVSTKLVLVSHRPACLGRGYSRTGPSRPLRGYLPGRPGIKYLPVRFDFVERSQIYSYLESRKSPRFSNIHILEIIQFFSHHRLREKLQFPHLEISQIFFY